MVLTIKYRPKTFGEVIGQPMAVKLLKAIAKNPNVSQKSLILSGAWGTGKTTLARIFGKALSCENFSKVGDVCGKCKSCIEWDTVSNRYIEYDSAMVGNVGQIRELKPVFELATSFYRVIVLDEAHLISRAAQSAMLKVIEEGNPNTFFLLCSTDPQMILNTIHSRSLPVEFNPVDTQIISEYLGKLAKEEGQEVSTELLDRIAFKSEGHVRDALMLLQCYLISHDEGIIQLPIDVITEFFFYARKGDQVKAMQLSKAIMKYPLHQVHRSMNYVIMQMVACYTMKLNNRYTEVVELYGQNTMELFRLVSENWSQGVYVDRYLTAAFFMSLLKIFGR
jgi:DNA polymerase III subunit gamma/tau